jgi:hypothetical protein
MKKIFLVILTLTLFISACTPKTTSSASETLTVSIGETHKTYTLSDLQALGNTQATSNGVTYIGVQLTTLLANAGIDPANLSAVKAVAVDGFSANYDPSVFSLPDTLVAYARVDGPLSSDELPFRMVLPNQEGKFNVRMLTEIVAIP